MIIIIIIVIIISHFIPIPMHHLLNNVKIHPIIKADILWHITYRKPSL